ncbi:MAG TPA: winged helix-turn-helix domain-containing protein [Kofleriaceae bacterium]|nr:winged helix-turn-helix domain-containing protein [Kofleriaceae bacterium]
MSTRPRRTRTIPPPLAPPFPRAVPTWVGRESELARAVALFERETLHLIYGVGGVGKSEFVFRLFDEVREKPAWTIAPAVLVGVRPGMAPEHVVAAMRVAIGPRRAKIAINTSGAAGLEDDLAEAARVLDAAPILVFLDDVHHLAPEAAARVLGFLSRHVRKSRIVASSRVEIPLPEGTPPPAIHRLGPLDEGATRDLVTRLSERLGVAPPDGSLVYRRSGGSPFYVLRDVAGDPGGEVGALDQTLRELPDDARALLGALASARAPLSPRDVQELGADTALRELGRRFLVDALRDQVLVHDLVRDAWVRTASLRERAAAHRRMADLCRARAEKDGKVAPADAGDVVEAVRHLVAAGDAEEAWELAQHAYRSVAAAGLDHLLLDDLRAMGGLLAGDREQIALMSARILVRRSQIAEAADVLAALGDRGSHASFRWLVLSGEVAQRRGRLGESESFFRRGRAAATTPAEKLQAALELADVASLRGQNDEARRVLEAARAEHEPLAPRDQGRFGWSIVLSYIIEERFAEAAIAAQQAAAPLGGGGHEDLEVLLALLEVLARAELDDLAGATALLDRVVARATAAGALREHVQQLYRGLISFFAGELATAEGQLATSFSYLTDHADHVMASIGGYYHVSALLARGEIALGVDLAARMTRLAAASELETLAPHGRAVQAEALLAAGRTDEARGLAEAALAAPRVCDQARWLAHTVLARAAAEAGDLATARAHLNDAIAPLGGDPDATAEHLQYARARRAAHDLEIARVELAGGDPTRAAEAAERARRHYRSTGRRGQEARATIAVAAARAALAVGAPEIGAPTGSLTRGGPGVELDAAEEAVGAAELLARACGYRRVLARCALVRAAIARKRGGDPRISLAIAADPAFPEGRAVLAARGEAEAQPGVRATLAGLGLLAGPRHRVSGRGGARVVTDAELEAVRATHPIVVEPARASLTAHAGGATRVDRGRPLLCELFAVLVDAQGQVVTPEALFLQVWGGPEYHPLRHRNTLYVGLKRLRQALRDLLGDDREIVETASGGWRLADGVDAVVVRPAD